MLGKPNEGVKVLMSGLDYERLVLAAGPVGLMQAALDVAVPYSTQRKQFGTPIGQFQVRPGRAAKAAWTLASMRQDMRVSKAPKRQGVKPQSSLGCLGQFEARPGCAARVVCSA